jgi:hypothetical protein
VDQIQKLFGVIRDGMSDDARMEERIRERLVLAGYDQDSAIAHADQIATALFDAGYRDEELVRAPKEEFSGIVRRAFGEYDYDTVRTLQEVYGKLPVYVE